MISKFRTVVRHYLYELVLALFKMAAIFCLSLIHISEPTRPY